MALQEGEEQAVSSYELEMILVRIMQAKLRDKGMPCLTGLGTDRGHPCFFIQSAKHGEIYRITVSKLH